MDKALQALVAERIPAGARRVPQERPPSRPPKVQMDPQSPENQAGLTAAVREAGMAAAVSEAGTTAALNKASMIPTQKSAQPSRSWMARARPVHQRGPLSRRSRVAQGVGQQRGAPQHWPRRKIRPGQWSWKQLWCAQDGEGQGSSAVRCCWLLRSQDWGPKIEYGEKRVWNSASLRPQSPRNTQSNSCTRTGCWLSTTSMTFVR